MGQLVVFDNCQRGECLAEADTFGEDATVVCFQLVDDAGGRILLKAMELLPDDAVPVAGALIRKRILAHVLKELAEDAVEHEKVSALGRVLLIYRGNVVADQIGRRGFGHGIILLHYFGTGAIDAVPRGLRLQIARAPCGGRRWSGFSDLRNRPAAQSQAIAQHTDRTHCHGRRSQPGS